MIGSFASLALLLQKTDSQYIPFPIKNVRKYQGREKPQLSKNTRSCYQVLLYL